MAFGDTGILDNFNRGDEGPPPSTNWTADIFNNGDPAGEVLSNECSVDTGEANISQWWNVETFGADSEVFTTLVDISTGEWVFIRLQTPGTNGLDGYEYGDEAGTSVIYRIDNKVETQLGATTPQVFGAGDRLGMDAIGSDISGYIDAGGGWAQVLTRSDATYGGAGNIGYFVEGTASDAQDNFGGGTIVVATFSLIAQNKLLIGKFPHLRM